MKKLLLILALVMILALGACSAKQSTPSTADTAAPGASDTSTKDTATKDTATQDTAPANQADSKISIDEAKNIALTDAGFTEADVIMTKTVLETDDGVEKYEIEFKNSGYEYEYDIDPKNGNILEKNKEIDD